MTAAASGAGPGTSRCGAARPPTLTPRSAQASSATGHAMPSAAGRARRKTRAGRYQESVKREWNEVEQFLQQRLQGFQARVAGELRGNLMAHGERPLERRLPAVAQSVDGHRRLLGLRDRWSEQRYHVGAPRQRRWGLRSPYQRIERWSRRHRAPADQADRMS